MKKMYKVSTIMYNAPTRSYEVLIEKETEKSVWVDGRRYDKQCSGHSFFDTEEEAKLHCEMLQIKRIRNIKDQLITAENVLLKIQDRFTVIECVE